ncbi:hypothetical protein PVK06_046807 [Gossypium arboreum]|uniref:Uncharacterized protein n=1 Tax=Gossypium arboreum TaxID=29729 RepID=A0ABR0MBP6_GOSAR|nr:hypothetical protein PVK06_046807 [Gossypium arboreum]
MCLLCIAYTINEWQLWRQFIMRWWDASYHWKFGPHIAFIAIPRKNSDDFQDQILQCVLQNSMEKRQVASYHLLGSLACKEEMVTSTKEGNHTSYIGVHTVLNS